MSDTISGQFFSSQFHFTDIKRLCRRAFRLYHQLVASPILRVELYGHLIKYRSRQRISRFSGTIRIKAHHIEDSPSGHRSGIIIAGNSVGGILEILLQKAVQLFLRAPLLTLEIRKKDGRMQCPVRWQGRTVLRRTHAEACLRTASFHP